MADTLGPITLERLRIIRLDNNRVQLAGYYDSELEREQLRELCNRVSASRVINLLDGTFFPVDMSEGQHNLVYCLFDLDEFIDGFYLIVGYSYDPGIGHVNFFPYVLTLQFIGTRGQYFRKYEVTELTEVTTEW